MAPTLLPGDILFAARLAAPSAFQRGDLIIFQRSGTDTAPWTKRVIALPGDRVQLHEGRLHLNGKPVPRDDLGPYEVNEAGQPVVAERYRETLPDSARPAFDVLEIADNQPFDNTPEYRVPEGHVFVLGDHRDNSLDSRAMASFGFVPMTRVLAQPRFILWSRDWRRIGTRLD